MSINHLAWARLAILSRFLRMAIKAAWGFPNPQLLPGDKLVITLQLHVQFNPKVKL